MADSLGAGVGAVSTSRQGVDSGSAPDKKRAVSWMDRFGQLQNFKEMHGHTLVPKRYGNDEMIRQNPADGGGVSVDRQDSSTMRGLGAWVQRQRQVRELVLTACSREDPLSGLLRFLCLASLFLFSHGC
jgi:hypothetical protein